MILVNAADERFEESWEAGRQLSKDLLRRASDFLAENGLTFGELRGIFVYKGPGSFTGLRIGLMVMNSESYAHNLPIVGETGDDWVDTCLFRLKSSENDNAVMPLYGADARVTLPRK